MNKQEIVRRALNKGFLISPDALEKLTEKNIDAELDKAKAKGHFILSDAAGSGEIVVSELKHQKHFTPADYVAYYNNKYKALHALLSHKVSAISINKAVHTNSDISLIGMVWDRTGKGFIIDDTTGSIEIVTKEQLSHDDVIGVKGFVKDGSFFTKEIIYPDIPLSRPVPNRIATILLSEKTVDGIGADHTFSQIGANPAHISIKGKDGIQILAYRPGKNISVKQAVLLLKKRHLCPERSEIKSTEDVFVINTVPDIFWLRAEEQGVEIYKGVLIVSPGKGWARIDMATGKVEFGN